MVTVMNRRVTRLWLAGWLAVCGAATGAESTGRVLLKPKFLPDAERMGLFDALAAGLIDARMMPRDATGGSLFLENLSDRPLTIELPEAVVGVQVLPQFGNLFQQAGNGQGNAGNGGQGAGANQPVGAGFQGNFGNGATPNLIGNAPFNQAPRQNFFSIPPERIARVPYHSVCLEHGAVDPKRGNVYRLVQVNEFSADPRLPHLLKQVGAQAESTAALQAAAWHIVNGMSWEQLQAKPFHRAAAPDTPYFESRDLQTARRLVEQVEQLAAQEPREPATDEPAPKLAKARR